jgi:hypothetical protein
MLEGTDEADTNELNMIKMAEEYWAATNPPPNIYIAMDPEFKKEFVAGYAKDRGLGQIWSHCDSDPANWVPGRHFFRDESSLLFFSNADCQPWLCVPENQKWRLLQELHKNPMETVHAGPEKLWQHLLHLFYWQRMKIDIERFCASCNVCQKTKPSNFNKYGHLMPNPIPQHPYDSISMDFIVNLPWLGEYNAIFVVVDRLSKHASFIPMTPKSLEHCS